MWKYGLRLVRCGCASLYKCHQCKDFGEYWINRSGGKFFMGEIRKRANLKGSTLYSEVASGLTTSE